MEPTNWAPEHSDALREHLAKGMSFSKVAKAINSRFNTTYSRSAVLGRATRMGLTGEVRSTSPSGDRSAAVRGIGEARPTEP
jgi:GcrA cell cycle regulator